MPDLGMLLSVALGGGRYAASAALLAVANDDEAMGFVAAFMAKHEGLDLVAAPAEARAAWLQRARSAVLGLRAHYLKD